MRLMIVSLSGIGMLACEEGWGRIRRGEYWF